MEANKTVRTYNPAYQDDRQNRLAEAVKRGFISIKDGGLHEGRKTLLYTLTEKGVKKWQSELSNRSN